MFVPKSNRGKYCPDCAQYCPDLRRQSSQAAEETESERKKEVCCGQLRAGKALICKAPQALNRGGWYHLSFAPENGPLTVHKTRYDKHDLYSPAGKRAFSFTRLPNFLFEAPTFQPLSNEAKVLYAFVLRRAEFVPEERLGGRVRAGLPVLPHLRGGRFAPLRAAEKRSTPCGSCSMRGWWKSRNRAVENPTAFTTQPHLPEIL